MQSIHKYELSMRVYKIGHVGIKVLHCAVDVKGVGLHFMNFWVTSKTSEFIKCSVQNAFTCTVNE
jgi:limonene-1,2-epoxide hydrolase